TAAKLDHPLWHRISENLDTLQAASPKTAGNRDVSYSYLEVPLCANDVETITRREFTLEGRGRNIPWLCPLSLMERLLRRLAPKLRMAAGRRWFRRRTPRRRNSSCALVAAASRPRRNCASLAKRTVRQAFLEGSGRSCVVRGSILVGVDRLASPT